MASDIVPIQLSLTEGDLVTLWAPRWRENGEEWEAFLGDDDALFAFPEVAQLAAFVRVEDAHDLGDHPAWPVVADLSVAELTPEEANRYDVIGVPELAAEDHDQWTVGELAEIVGMVRSIAEVCDLEVVDEVLDSAPGFGLLDQGMLPFVGREGAKLWTQLVDTIAERWDDVIDALDELVTVPRVDMAALAAAEKEAAELAEREAEADALTAGGVALTAGGVADDGVDDRELDLEDDEPDEDGSDDDGNAAVAAEPGGEAGEKTGDEAAVAVEEEPPGFWEEVGIDPIRIVTDTDDLLTLRCYLDDRPIFLGTGGEIDTFPTRGALVRFLATGAEGNDMAELSTWVDVVERAAARELEVVVDPLNRYVLPGLDDDLAEGPMAVDPIQLEQAVELVRDVGDWAGDDEPREALAESQSLGWLVSFVIRPDPTRLAPSPPYEADAAKWRELVDELEKRLVKR
ncbi:MAG: hypothetical protein QOK35_3345 [Pseudonocardiales bacterium]|nr:hypothetical protein [Pseudonocardiales bacterium]